MGDERGHILEVSLGAFHHTPTSIANPPENKLRMVDPRTPETLESLIGEDQARMRAFVHPWTINAHLKIILIHPVYPQVNILLPRIHHIAPPISLMIDMLRLLTHLILKGRQTPPCRPSTPLIEHGYRRRIHRYSSNRLIKTPEAGQARLLHRLAYPTIQHMVHRPLTNPDNESATT